MKPVFDCQTLSRLLSDGLDRKLPSTDRARMRLHLVMCRACRNVDEQMQFMREAMRRLGQQEGDGGGPVAAKRGEAPPEH